MSTTKLTLTIQDGSVIEHAKSYAKKRGRSLPNLVENYLKSLNSGININEGNEELSPLVKSLLGVGGMAPEKTDKELLLEALEEKYLT